MAQAANNNNDDKSTSFQSSETLNCDICGLSGLRQRDYEIHIEGRGHRKKIRAQQRQVNDKGDDKNFNCEYCNRNFRGEEFYKAHLGTKTHRRNVKKNVEDQSKPTNETPVVNRVSRRLRRISFNGHLDTDFLRKKYKTRADKIKDLNYKSYIYSLTSYLSLRLALDQNIEDFAVSVNDRDWQAFGDVVLQIHYKDKKVTYAIQCKKVTQIPRQIDQLEQSKLNVDKQYNCIAHLKNMGKDIADTKFIIFTTWNISSSSNHSVTLKPKILNEWKTSGEDTCTDATVKVKSLSKRNDIINVTNDPENIYSFTLSENLNYHLPQLFLFTNQRIFASMFNQLLKSKFDKSPDIMVEYTKYIEKWIDGKLGGNYKLNKKDVVLVIGEILLKPFVVSPKKVHFKHDYNYAVWNQVISHVDLTVVKNELFTISKVCQPFNAIIEETLETNIDTITKSLRIKKEIFFDIGEPFKSYFFEVAQEKLSSNDDIPLNIVYNVFWKVGRIPLLMSTEGQEHVKGFIVDVILFMKQMGVNKKFLIKSADLNLNRFKDSLKIFTCLEDVKSFINWDEVKILVSQSHELPLSTIQQTDPFFFKWVTPNIFFDISIRKYVLKPNYTPKKNYKKKEVLKIILSEHEKSVLEQQLFPEMSETNSEYYNVTRLRGIEPGIL